MNGQVCKEEIKRKLALVTLIINVMEIFLTITVNLHIKSLFIYPNLK